MLKPAKELDKMDDASEDIYYSSLIDRYAARPDSIGDMCLAEFAANYSIRTGIGDDETPQVFPTPEEEMEEEQDWQPSCIKLKNGLGVMHKRR